MPFHGITGVVIEIIETKKTEQKLFSIKIFSSLQSYLKS